MKFSREGNLYGDLLTLRAVRNLQLNLVKVKKISIITVYWGVKARSLTLLIVLFLNISRGKGEMEGSCQIGSRLTNDA
jgi:hypothetical protein